MHAKTPLEVNQPSHVYTQHPFLIAAVICPQRAGASTRIMGKVPQPTLASGMSDMHITAQTIGTQSLDPIVWQDPKGTQTQVLTVELPC